LLRAAAAVPKRFPVSDRLVKRERKRAEYLYRMRLTDRMVGEAVFLAFHFEKSVLRCLHEYDSEFYGANGSQTRAG
jgi:hypothetical protein